MHRTFRIACLVALGTIVALSLVGCELLNNLIGSGGSGPGGGANVGWVSGNPTPVASQMIGPGGGQVTVTDPGGPIDGMTIDVPAGALTGSTRFDVSYTPITGTVGPNVDPVTPLITVEDGGDFAHGVMTVTLPVEIASGQFAMGFLVDRDGHLEGMPIVDVSAASITVATAHFSRFFISSIETAALTGVIDSGFRPMVDDWQFANRGSYIAPGGHCAGQALTAMWYYIERAQAGASALYSRFDNNGDAPATPDLWQDDSLGYRLASVVQHDIEWDNWLREVNKVLGASDDPLNWQAFLYTMLVTGEPQYVAIYSATGGHAMIVYKADAATGTLYIADPNYPGNTGRTIQYAGGSFAPYNSGPNKAAIDAGQGTAYPTIRYFAKSALVDWDLLDARWTAFDEGTIGDGIFPAYTLSVSDDAGGFFPLEDGATVSNDSIEVLLDDGDPAISSSYAVWRGDDWISFDPAGRIPLDEGENRLGFYLVSQAGQSYEYGDFQWITIRRTGAGYVTISVQVHGYWEHVHPNEPNPDTGEPGVVYYDDSPYEANAFTAYAQRSLTDGLFHAEWYDLTLPGGEGPYTGGMNVQFNEDMSEILWFYASESQPIDGSTHVWSAGGANVPRAREGNGFYEYIIDGPDVCSHLDVFSDDKTFPNGNTSQLTHYTCEGTSQIQIHWYEQPPAWLPPG